MSNINIDFNPNDFVYFVLLERFVNRASNGFKIDYDDVKSGRVCINDPRGLPMRFKFNKSTRMIRIPASKTELVEAIRNHPSCLNSVNGSYSGKEGHRVHTNALFSEMNEEKDARVALDAAHIKKNAIDLAFEIIKDAQKSYDAMVVLGLSRRGDMGNSDLIQYAMNNPQEFLDQIQSADFEARALIKKALDKGILSKDGVTYVAGELKYGVELEEMVKEVIKDEDKRTYLERKLQG